MKYWEEIKRSGQTYSEAIRRTKVEGNEYITRPLWGGIHFVRNNEYFILLKDGVILENPITIMGLDENDWMTVSITEKAKEIINNHFKGE